MQKDRSLALITLIVVLIHGLGLFWEYSHPTPKKFQEIKPIRLSVQTISLNPPSATVVVSEPPAPSIVEEVSLLEVEVPPTPEEISPLIEEPPHRAEKKIQDPQQNPKPRKPEKKTKKIPTKQEKPKRTNTSPKKPPPKAKPKSKTPKPPEEKKKSDIDPIALARQQKLLNKAQENIAKIMQKSDKASPSSQEGALPNVPGLINSLKIESVGEEKLSERETNYRQELASRLKLSLRLPEYGEVKLKLTLERTGKVAKLVVLSAESKANQGYVERTLPSLKFPAFGTFTNESEYTFSIKLSNE